tara:strand:+ start:1157 stop:1282 length:126 start_codon:yes stop_codon:yes gene_type:complete
MRKPQTVGQMAIAERNAVLSLAARSWSTGLFSALERSFIGF